MDKTNRVTLKDIAEKLGVSKTTVSKVLNNQKSEISISEATKAKVFKCAKKMGYQPNYHARALVSKKTNTLGLIIDNILDPFFNEMILGIEEQASKNHYKLLLTTITNNKSISKTINTFLMQNIADGILIGTTNDISKYYNFLKNTQKKGIPVVLLANKVKNLLNINVKNKKGGYIATKYLLNLGHKNIGIITGPKINLRHDSKQRLEGYIKALNENNVPFDEKLVEEGKFSFDSGYKSAKKLIVKNKNIEAIFSCDDLMALGAIRAIIDEGYNVPEDISIIGFDNIMHARYSNPRLTTIAQPRIKMGKAAAKLIINVIENKNYEKEITFEPEIIERESCFTGKV